MPGDEGGSFDAIAENVNLNGRNAGPAPDLELLDGQTAILSLIDAFPGPAWLVDKADLVVAVNAPASTLRIQTAVSALAAEIRQSGRALTRRLAVDGDAVAGASMILELTGLVIGQNERAISVVLGQDVTFEGNLTAALIASRELYRDLMQCSGDFAWQTNSEGRFTFISVKHALGFESGALIGRKGIELLDPERPTGEAPFLARMAVEDVDIWVRAATGETRCMAVNALPMTEADGSWIGARGICRDVTEERARQISQIEKLERLSATDELTGLMNRRAFASEAARRLAMTRRQARAAVFLYLDLDHFKTINDSLGHHAGDAVLRRLGQLLLHSSRSNDLAVRLGGDEFGLWLDATDMPGAVTKAEVLMQMVPTIAQDLPPDSPKLGVSIGLAAVGSGIESLEQILMRADQALYAVKRAGRGGWRIGPNPPDGSR